MAVVFAVGLVLTPALGIALSAHALPAARVGLDVAAIVSGNPASANAAARPAASLSLGSNGSDPTAISLNWSKTTLLDFTNYTVYVEPQGSSGAWQVAAVTTGATTTTIDSLAPGAANSWMVTAFGFVDSQSSNIYNATQPTLSYLSYTTPTSTSAAFLWTNNASYGGGVAFVNYSLYESSGGGGYGRVFTTSNAATTSHTVTGLSSATSYSFFLNTTDCVASCGTASPSHAVLESNTVTFGTPLPLSASVTATRPVVDVGQRDLLTCTPSGGRSPFTFGWSIAGGPTQSGASSISTAFNATGPNSVSCTITDAGSSTATAATSVTVDPEPRVTIVVNRTAADIGGTIAYACSASQGTPPFSYTWSFGDGSGFSGGLITHVYSAAGQYAASCVAEDSTSTQEPASVSILVSWLPQLAVAATAWAAAPATAIAFTAVASNGSGGYGGYHWDFGDGTSAIGAAVTHRFSGSANFSVTATAHDSNGGLASSVRAVWISPIVVTVASSATSIAPGGTIVLTANASGGARSSYNYTWQFGDGTLGYGARVSHRFVSAGTFHPRVTATDALGASANASTSSVSVVPPTSPTNWLTSSAILVLAVIVGALLAIAVYALLRRSSARAVDYSGRIPPTDPSSTLRGTKVCAYCGTANLPMRDTCVACGRPLRRSLFG